AERADAVLAGQGQHPPVPARHVDDLAVHAELLEIAGGPAGPLGNLLAGTEHADRHGKRLRANVKLQFAVGGFDVDHPRSPRDRMDRAYYVRSGGRNATATKPPPSAKIRGHSVGSVSPASWRN